MAKATSFITDIRIRTVDNIDKVKAFCDLVFNDHFICKGFRVMEFEKDGEKSLRVMMPSRKSGNNWEDLFHPITKDGYAELQEIVLKKYKEAAQKSGANATSNNNDKSTKDNIEEEASDLPANEEVPF